MSTKEKQNLFYRFIKGIEVVGNKIPHPFYMFLYLAIAVLILSAIMSAMGVSVTYLGVGADGKVAETVTTVRNLISADYLQSTMSGWVKTYVNFAPLGLIMVMMLSIGYAQSTGLFEAVLRKTLLGAPVFLVTFILSMVGVCSNIASDAGLILAATLGGAIFSSIGRNPIIGALTGFVSCYGAWSANLLIAGTDVLLSGITQSAAESMGVPGPTHPMVNYYFMAAATFVVAGITTFVTEKIMPKIVTIGKINPPSDLNERVTPEQNRGVKWAGWATLAYVVLILAMIIPPNGILRAADGSIIPKSPFISGIVSILFMLFVVAGTAYGFGAGTIKNKEDIPNLMGSGIVSALSFYVVALPAAFFIQFFNDSRIATILAVSGGEFLKSLNFSGIPLAVSFVLLSGFINLLVTGASEKWMILAPIFVPMFAVMNFSPALTQVCYRIGDSFANPMAPVNFYLPIFIAIISRYRKDDDPEYGIGTVMSLVVPYSLCYAVGLIALLIVFMMLGLPLGPGAPLFLS